MQYPDDRLYSPFHQWVLKDENDKFIVTIGITDFAQDTLGNISRVDFADIGKVFNQGDISGMLESLKTCYDLQAPVSAEVININKILFKSPALLNTDPFGEGWLYQLRLSDLNELEGLLTCGSYLDLL